MGSHDTKKRRRNGIGFKLKLFPQLIPLRFFCGFDFEL
jgi:hypothetical protein